MASLAGIARLNLSIFESFIQDGLRIFRGRASWIFGAPKRARERGFGSH